MNRPSGKGNKKTSSLSSAITILTVSLVLAVLIFGFIVLNSHEVIGDHLSASSLGFQQLFISNRYETYDHHDMHFQVENILNYYYYYYFKN
jgi:hypothetical protein